jgi:predicted nucleotidyltransferase
MIELPLSDEQVAMYHAMAKRRRELARPAELERRKVGWTAARQAAELLRTQYNATRVVVFGSLVHDGRFTRWSDVDIAAWGLAAKDSLSALGAVMDLDVGIEVNLVDVNTCTPELLAVIEEDGIEI